MRILIGGNSINLGIRRSGRLSQIQRITLKDQLIGQKSRQFSATVGKFPNEEHKSKRHGGRTSNPGLFTFGLIFGSVCLKFVTNLRRIYVAKIYFAGNAETVVRRNEVWNVAQCGIGDDPSAHKPRAFWHCAENREVRKI